MPDPKEDDIVDTGPGQTQFPSGNVAYKSYTHLLQPELHPGSSIVTPAQYSNRTTLNHSSGVFYSALHLEHNPSVVQ